MGKKILSSNDALGIQILDLQDRDSYSENIEKAVQALLAGRIVAFPTETLYGLGVNAHNRDAIENLYRVKERPEEKKMAIMVTDSEAVKEWVRELPPAAEKLMKLFWPGPLTIVLLLPDMTTIGFRNPDNRVIRDIIRCAGVPIASTSANISGSQPAIDAQQVAAYLGDKIDLVLDDGPTQLKKPSTVVKVYRETFEIIRHGIIQEERISRCIHEDSLSLRS
ncbi:MAG: threonylcarbamoyl-AMP synthase [Candidatus Scalindua sp.]|nr:threonylcarbamoyl-AMP synthase [Candidatus Scalindua sp.]